MQSSLITPSEKEKAEHPWGCFALCFSLGLRSQVTPQCCLLSSSVAKIVIKTDKPIFDLSVFLVSFSGYIV